MPPSGFVLIKITIRVSELHTSAPRSTNNSTHDKLRWAIELNKGDEIQLEAKPGSAPASKSISVISALLIRVRHGVNHIRRLVGSDQDTTGFININAIRFKKYGLQKMEESQDLGKILKVSQFFIEQAWA